ncbi:hypothetical protein AJ85_05635 [Alkalihalobacillus alcalophilus ATCC 27647 = CGMCC 1.3604]|uniref:XkdN n=1 Tax=Alkalihalobacillus alcalophilus ATCC 27647 = CGMCC 1.3604 TaxID=1218173 RepID=A0A094WGJ5_ALKAL|nr:XkdN-like protein [Alkalihalobacillus alcalophilus]YP_009276845.1 tail protein XkdN-like [Bacillus phage BalMu-1]AJA42417.1 XkdN [Bacillus phage BalMu-1]AJA42473.1 XkdN [Bacillus phage BalMu-1]KGA96869.1 hypothetical protein BALCAV_0213715 [Alkalihalobacillus alcalophilus ATCC 27647 = CGMCC 1.3604]MED1561159.1 hypothetical protein [Alkalihalobacillus alcalophilus]THG91304.1 hypothetical protein AJ85_05635 [Alkalihalobacillus alcalophilus ATCC 27647 = CGMCC 1.3604]
MTTKLNETQILDKLFNASESVPERTVSIKRIGLSFTIKGLKAGTIEKLQKRYTHKQRVRGEETEELDRPAFNRALIVDATKAIGGDEKVKWDNGALKDKFKASSGQEVLKRVLLAGEISQLADQVMDLSGFYDYAEEDNEAKNSSEDKE